MRKILFKIVLLCALAFSLQGCITTYSLHFKYVHHLGIDASLGGTYWHLQHYDIDILIDDDSTDMQKNSLYPRFDHIKAESGMSYDVLIHRTGFCMSSISGGDIWGCNGNHLFKDITATIVLVNKETQKKFVLDKRVLKISEHRKTTLEVQAYLASDKSDYIERGRFATAPSEFDWEKAKFVYSEELQDSLYFYSKVITSERPNY